MPMYPPPAVERAMKRMEVITRAMSGEITWIQAAEIAGVSTRSLRRWKTRWQRDGYDGLLDRRTGRPSPKRAPLEEVQRVEPARGADDAEAGTLQPPRHELPVRGEVVHHQDGGLLGHVSSFLATGGPAWR